MRHLWILGLLVFTASTAWGEGGSSRTENRFGFNIGANNTPPGLYGLNLSFNFTDWLQLEVGGGFASQGLGETFAQELGTTVTTTALYIITLTLIDWDDIRDFLKDENEAVARTVFSFGGGLNFFYPGWSLSPVIGIGYAGWEAKNDAFDLPNRDRHFYYKVGADWQTSGGFHLALGWMHAPDLPNPLKDKVFGQIGMFF